MAEKSIPVSNPKTALRKALMERREAMVRCEQRRIDEGIARHTLGLEAFGRAGLVLTYLSVGDEVDTRRIIEASWRQGKRVALPYCVPRTRSMRWFRVSSFDGLVRNPFGIEEPVPNPDLEVSVHAGERVLAIVPGLAFDLKGYRIGYGGGYYDRFLASFAGTSIGLCREEFLVDDLGLLDAIDAHDLPVDLVVT